MSGALDIDEFIGITRPGEEASGPALSAGAKKYAAALRAQLAELQAAGATGAAVNAANSDGLDRLIRRLYEVAASAHYSRHGATGSRVALVAVGGYARREMSIGSDVDLLVLEDAGAEELSSDIAHTVQTALWDAGLQVGAAVRTASDSVLLAQSDVPTQTALLAARFLAGDATLFHELMRAVRERAIPALGDFAERQLAALRERHLRMGESLYLLQPNLKEGAGGLRDYHTAYWVARACERDFRELPDLLHVGLLTESELREYQHALDFLWRVRNELHLHHEAQDRPDELRAAGAARGQLDFEPDLVSGELPVERFMRDYYRHARAVQTYSEIVIEQCLARVRPKPASPGVAGGRGLPQSRRPARDPARGASARAAAAPAARIRGGAGSRCAALAHRAAPACARTCTWSTIASARDPAATACCLRILASPRRVMRTLIAMNEAGLLGRFLPEWEHIVCRWQHVIYHTYTVDVHSIFLVEELRRLWQGKYADARAGSDRADARRRTTCRCSSSAACCTTSARASAATTRRSGAELGEKCLARLGLPRSERRARSFLVRHHLLMSHVAQRRDLSDPKVIVEFARTCGDRENLRNLYLADLRRHARLLEAGLDRVARRAAARAVRAHGGVPRDRRATTQRVALEQIEARVGAAQDAGARASCARSASRRRASTRSSR